MNYTNSTNNENFDVLEKAVGGSVGGFVIILIGIIIKLYRDCKADKVYINE